MSDRTRQVQLVFEVLGKEGGLKVLLSLRESIKSQKEIRADSSLGHSQVSARVHDLRLLGLADQKGARNAPIDVGHAAEEIDNLVDAARELLKKATKTRYEHL